MEFLISQGHSHAFEYTPKQLIAFYNICSQRKASEYSMMLKLNRMAYHADKDGIKKTLKELSKRGQV